MKTQSSDTSIKTEEVLINLIRQKSISERISKVLSLSSFIIKISKRAIARANPDKSERELDLLFIKYHYGNDLESKVKRYLLSIANEKE